MGNLTGILRIDVPRGDADPVQRVADAVRRGREAGEDAASVRHFDAARWLPLWLLEAIGRRSALQSQRERRYGASATVSNLGRLGLDELSGGGFEPRTAFFIPPASPGLPLFLTLTGVPGALELCAGAPVTLAGEGRLETLLAEIAAVLAEQPDA